MIGASSFAGTLHSGKVIHKAYVHQGPYPVFQVLLTSRLLEVLELLVKSEKPAKELVEHGAVSAADVFKLANVNVPQSYEFAIGETLLYSRPYDDPDKSFYIDRVPKYSVYSSLLDAIYAYLNNPHFIKCQYELALTISTTLFRHRFNSKFDVGELPLVLIDIFRIQSTHTKGADCFYNDIHLPHHNIPFHIKCFLFSAYMCCSKRKPDSYSRQGFTNSVDTSNYFKNKTGNSVKTRTSLRVTMWPLWNAYGGYLYDNVLKFVEGLKMDLINSYRPERKKDCQRIKRSKVDADQIEITNRNNLADQFCQQIGSDVECLIDDSAKKFIGQFIIRMLSSDHNLNTTGRIVLFHKQNDSSSNHSE